MRPPARAALVAVACAVALAAGCGGGGGETRTERPPRNALVVTTIGADGARFSVDLDCDISDRDPCAEVIEALAAVPEGDCPPIADAGEVIRVHGQIDGQGIDQVVPRRTVCEARTYDAIAAALRP